MEHEGAKQLALAARRLTTTFESIREGVRHAGERGRETQDALLAFLNQHLPKRFQAASGFILAPPETMSGHEDVIIYDQQEAYVFAPAETTLVVPNDYVAAVIEVKSTLDKRELEDAAAKISAAKGLAKAPELPTDYADPNSRIQLTGTRGIVFAYSAATSLESLYANLREINATTDSDQWIDEIVVLGVGSISYRVTFPISRATTEFGGKTSGAAQLFPVFVSPAIQSSPDFVLATFMQRLGGHLSHYRRRPAPRGDLLMPLGLTSKLVGTYWYDTKGKLHELPLPSNEGEKVPPLPAERIVFTNVDGAVQGQVEWLPWADGHVYAFRLGTMPIAKHVLETVMLHYRDLRVHTLEVAPGILMTSLLPGAQPIGFHRAFELLNTPQIPYKAMFIDLRA